MNTTCTTTAANAPVCAILDWDNLTAKHTLKIDIAAFVSSLRRRGVGHILVVCNFMQNGERQLWNKAGVSDIWSVQHNCDNCVERAALRLTALPSTRHIILATGDHYAENLVKIFGRFVSFSIVSRANALARRVKQVCPVEFFVDQFVVGRFPRPSASTPTFA